MIFSAKGELGGRPRHQVLALENVFLTLSSARVSMNVLFYIKTSADVLLFFSFLFSQSLSIKIEIESAEATVPSEVPIEKSRQHEARPNRHHNINI